MLKILCANCERDLTYSGGFYDHCLCLKDRMFGPNSDWILDFYVQPLLDQDKYFCGFGCLERWMQKNKEKDNGNKS